MKTKTKVHKKTTEQKITTAGRITDQPQPQEKGDSLLDSIQENFIAQSSTLSTVTRTTTGVILGTAWAICYKEKAQEIPNIWILLCLIICLVFFLIELAHYYYDSVFYHDKSDEIVECKGGYDYKRMYTEIQKHSKFSFFFLKLKAYVVFILGIIFVVGVLQLFLCPRTECKNKVQKVEQSKNQPPKLEVTSVNVSAIKN